MPKSFSKDMSILNSGEVFSSVSEIKSGSVALTLNVEWDRRSKCRFDLVYLREGHFLGLEYPFAPQEKINYDLKALTNVQIDETYRHKNQILSLDVNQSLVYLHKVVKTAEALATSFLELEKKYILIHKMATLLGLGVIYCEEQNISIVNRDKDLTLTLLTFLKQKDLKSKMFPLSQDIINYNFQEIRKEPYSKAKITVQFIKRMVTLLPSLSKALLAKDPIFRNYLIEDFSMKTNLIVESFKVLAESVTTMTHTILASDGYLRSYHDAINRSSKNPTAQKYLISLGSFVIKHLRDNIFGNFNEFSQDFKDNAMDLLASINEFDTSAVAGGKQGGQTPLEAAPEQFKGSVKQIIEYAQLHTNQDFMNKFFENYNKWRAFDNPLSADEDVRRVRNRVTQYYWDIYYHAFVQHRVKGKKLVPAVELMFLFGFFDETLVDGKTIATLYKRKGNQYREVPKIYTLYEWLHKIADRSVSPSLDAMGETYDDMIKDQLRDNENRDKKVDDLDTVEVRIHFEVMNLAKESAKVCNSEIGSYVPILIEEQMVVGVDLVNEFTTKESLSKAYKSLLNYDFSIFYREVRFKENSLEEFIKKEISPIFILVPNVGKRGMVWQPKEKPKDSPGRLVLSHISIGSLQKILVAMFGFYRWEIVKELLGPLWNDISQLSLTAEYADYSSSIKKNKDLSEESKEKVLIEFKKYRSDRDRFANDYRKWMLLESQGRPGLNRVMRDFFFRQVPFPRSIREQIRKMPAFAELADKYDNIIRREVNKLKLKYQRHTKSGEPLPQALQEYLDFYLR